MNDVTIIDQSPLVSLEQRLIGVDLLGAQGPSEYQSWLANGGIGSYGDFLNASVAAAGLTIVGVGGQVVGSRAALAGIIGPVAGQTAFLVEAGREGWFRFATGNQSAWVALDQRQGVFIAPAAAPSGVSGAWVRFGFSALTPEMFGAAGDGLTNDSDAFNGLRAIVQAFGGGEIRLRGAVYVVGKQGGATPGQWCDTPVPLLEFDGLARGLIVRGNGATMRCATTGLRFGAFTGPGGPAAPHHLQPGPDRNLKSSPYAYMIKVSGSTGPILIENIELDGSRQSYTLGGQWAVDTGWQIDCDGIGLFNNATAAHVHNVYTHHHGRDGLHIQTQCGDLNDVGVPVTAHLLRSEFNARQGMSIIGGRGHRFTRCRFAHTGRGGTFASAPTAGVDIEPETGQLIRQNAFQDCEFVDNIGLGLLVTDIPGTDDVVCDRCVFIGTVEACCWSRAPGVRYEDCTFTGLVRNVWGSADPGDATKFNRCRFLASTSRSPTGFIFGDYLVDLGSGGQNVLFDDCRFDTEDNLAALLPFLPDSCIIRNTSMVQTGTGFSPSVQGKWEGVNTVVSAGPFASPASELRYGQTRFNGVLQA